MRVAISLCGRNGGRKRIYGQSRKIGIVRGLRGTGSYRME